jgi:hypothetical protein
MGDVIPTSIRQELFRRMPAQALCGMALWPTGHGGEWACCLMGLTREQAVSVLQQILDQLTPEMYVPDQAANADDGADSEQAAGEAVADNLEQSLEKVARAGLERGATVSALHPRARHADQPE